MHMRTGGCHTMVTETSKTTNFRARFFYNTFLYWLANLLIDITFFYWQIVGLLHTAAGHSTFPIDVLFVQSNCIVTACFSKVVEQEYPHAETSMAPPASVTPAITDITVTAVVPPITLHTGATSNHLFPAKVSGHRTQTPL